MAAQTPYANGWLWAKVRLAVMERDGWVCQVRGPKCTIEASHCDHIIPWRSGGAWYDPENLRASCPGCNSRRAMRASTFHPSREW